MEEGRAAERRVQVVFSEGNLEQPTKGKGGVRFFQAVGPLACQVLKRFCGDIVCVLIR